MANISLFEFQRKSYEELGWTSDYPYLELLENLNDSSSDTLIEVGRHSLKATQYVGVLRVMDLTIQVLPKIDYDQRGSFDASPGSIPHKAAEDSARDNLLHMLSYVEDIRIHKQTAAELRTSEQDWFELLIRFFAIELHKQLLQGPYRTYIRKEEDLPVLKGKWLIAKQLATKPHVKDRFEVGYDEFTIDNDLNQIFLYVVEMLLMISKDISNRRLLMAIRALLADVTLFPKISESILDGVRFDRLNERFLVAFNLAKMFLDQEAMMLSKGYKNVFAFMFDMNILFERFVYGFLKKYQAEIFENEQQIRIKSQGRGQRIHLLKRLHDEKDFIRLRPDILLSGDRGQNLLILDTKYKHLTRSNRGPTVSENDLYQMVAYMGRFECQHSLLLYPSEKSITKIRESFRIPDRDHYVHITALNLHQPLSDPQPFMQEFRSIFRFIGGI